MCGKRHSPYAVDELPTQGAGLREISGCKCNLDVLASFLTPVQTQHHIQMAVGSAAQRR